MVNDSRKWLSRRERPSLAIGVHNALGARLAAEAGFDAVWLSGLELSTSAGLPDANLLTMTECADRAREIRRSCDINIIADCDNGYGNAHNVMHLVRVYEQAGVNAICIEDKCFPKVNSFVGERHIQVSIDEFVGKIKAAVAARRDALAIIGRIESLISGAGICDAIERAEAYWAAGADALLVHSKAKSPHEILEFLKLWDSRCPVVVVPTTYPSITARELHAAGASFVIYANQGIRASIVAMTDTFATIARDHHTMNVEGRIAPLKRVFFLQGLADFHSNEAQFIPPSPPTPPAVRAKQLISLAIESKGMPLEVISTKCLDHLTNEHVVLIRGLPPQPNILIDLLERIGPTGESYGLDHQGVHPRLNRVRYRPDDKNSLHGLGDILPPHSARNWSVRPHRYFAMYLLDPGFRGLPLGQNGETRLVWWRDVLLEARRRYPETFDEDFDLLMSTNVNISANNVIEETANSPLLYPLDDALDPFDVGVRLKADILNKIVSCHTTLGERYTRYFSALERIVLTSQLPEVSLCFPMEAGDLLVIDNRRIGHGRFDFLKVRTVEGHSEINRREIWSTTVS